MGSKCPWHGSTWISHDCQCSLVLLHLVFQYLFISYWQLSLTFQYFKSRIAIRKKSWVRLILKEVLPLRSPLQQKIIIKWGEENNIKMMWWQWSEIYYKNFCCLAPTCFDIVAFLFGGTVRKTKIAYKDSYINCICHIAVCIREAAVPILVRPKQPYKKDK